MYFETMQNLKHFNRSQGYCFFEPRTMKFFRSHVQTRPPYGGRIFVTSEAERWGAPRMYTVRKIQDNGSIKTIGKFQQFHLRSSAHAFAQAEAEKLDIRLCKVWVRYADGGEISGYEVYLDIDSSVEDQIRRNFEPADVDSPQIVDFKWDLVR